MTAVTIRPKFMKDSRPSNGLETIADELVADKQKVFYVVGAVKWAGGNVDEEGQLIPAAKFLAIEVAEDGSSMQGQIQQILDDARKGRGLGRAEESFPAPKGQMSGQIEFDFDGPDDGEPKRVGEVRLGPDGPHEVPPPSADEELAERAEAKAAGVPAAEFSGGDE